MSQSSLLRDLPKDPMQQNPEEARLVQSIINDNNPEMGYGGGYGGGGMQQMQQPGMQMGQGMQEGQNFMPNFDEQADMIPQMQNPSMPPGIMGGAQPIQMAQQPQMPQMVEPPMMPQQQMGYPQQMPQQMQMPQMPQQMQDMPDDRNWTEWMWDESKDTLIIAIVAFILSFRIIQNLIVNNVPYMGSGMMYMIFRSLLIGIFFYLIKKIWT